MMDHICINTFFNPRPAQSLIDHARCVWPDTAVHLQLSSRHEYWLMGVVGLSTPRPYCPLSRLWYPAVLVVYNVFPDTEERHLPNFVGHPDTKINKAEWQITPRHNAPDNPIEASWTE